MTKFVAAALGVVVIVLAAPASAQNFPDHPVKIIVPYPAGGPADTVAVSYTHLTLPTTPYV